jgi:hypothetical protein
VSQSFYGFEQKNMNQNNCYLAILSGQASEGSPPDRDPNIERLERLIREKYCLPCEVTFSDSQAKGTVTLTYHSLEELQGLLAAWGIEN